ncbi:hypothetical protein OG444_39965 (plasmid) [Streptomyces sp. NBC_01232]|uniref:hypothetical protein n=1 Tax=Streptomyces sp. NBC_01232 TaxID=2903786 RepID=UPI002E13606B|nr:hypothetical protein OG444_39965 [Streptomyces sp. NBC_01232]
MVVGFWHWIERNSAGLSLLVPFLAIGGGLLGNWLGAKVQAAGGLAQASAAREAARITAEAPRLAALRDERRLAIAELVRTSRRLFRFTGELYSEDRDAEARLMYEEVSQAYAEVELSAPASLVVLAQPVMEATQAALDAARLRGPAARAMAVLQEVADDGGTPGWAAHSAALRAREALRARRQDREALTREAVEVMRRCGLLSEGQIRAVIGDLPRGPVTVTQHERAQAYAGALREFLDAARLELGANREGGVEWIPQPGEARPTQI